MPTVGDLATELRCTANEVQRAARALGIAAKSPGYRLRPEDYRSIRDTVLVRIREAKAQEVAVTPIKPQAAPNPLAETSLAVRPSVGPVAGRTAARLLLHQDFVSWLWSPQTDSRLKRRANLILRQLSAFGRTSIVKSVRGIARGWRRSPLGGNQGRQFYLWWVPNGAPPIADLALPKDTVLVRSVRHHDETATALSPEDPINDYIELDPARLVNEADEFGYAFNDSQNDIASSRASIRFIKGHPGAGKTTALWLAASLAEGHRALYLTASPKLAADADQYFRALGPESLILEVMPFDQLITHLRQSPDSKPLIALDVEEAANEFEEVIANNYRGNLGPWDGRIDELYAELHAHAVGQALPIPISDLAVSQGLIVPKAEYIRRRLSVLGPQAAKAAAQIAAQLLEADLIETLFPAPARARRALDQILAGGALLERFRPIDLVFIDEVQDLTLVELELLVKFCAQIAVLREGRPPALIAAGDEGQTVRPSDFEWAYFADLTASLMGRRSDFDLLANVRSPRNIACIVNRSWEMYRHFAKDERPRGHASAEIEDASVGRVISTACHSLDDLRQIIETFDAIPNAALVYPGYRIPEEYAQLATTTPGLLLTSRAAKGLDFQTVGVLDVGRQMTRLKALAEDSSLEGKLSTLWGRILADHLRVALSRATENLVLIDLSPDLEAREQVRELCVEAEPMEMEPEELTHLLRRDDGDAAELALEFCEEVEKLLGTQSVRAYRRSRQAVALLGDPKSPNAVHDAALRRQAWTLRGVAAADLIRQRASRQRSTFGIDIKEVLEDAVTAFRRAERGADCEAIQIIDRFVVETAAPAVLMADARELLALLPRLERHIARHTRELLVGWCSELANSVPPNGASAQSALAECVGAITRELEGSYSDLARHFARILSNIASAARADGRCQDALTILASLVPRDHASEALCHDQLSNFAAAAHSYELAGDVESALRSLRRVPDVQGALRLAELLNHQDLPALRWLARYRAVMEALEPHIAAKLTEAERRLVAGVRDDALLESLPRP